MSWIEIAGVVFGLASIVLTTRESVWCWPTGIVNIVCFSILFLGAHLYADAALQVVYVGLSIYGWYSWSRPKVEVPVIRFSRREWLTSAAILLAGTLAVGAVFSRTDAVLPWVNAGTATASLIAQWMMTRKVLESWFVWIAADVVMIGVYVHQSLWLTGGLYVVYLCLCVSGYLAWKKSLSVFPAAAPATA
jgi:nicotinamide mononucleotide transporter